MKSFIRREHLEDLDVDGSNQTEMDLKRNIVSGYALYSTGSG